MKTDNSFPYHRLLARQIRKSTAANGKLDTALLYEQISNAYDEFDHSNRMNERVMRLISEEMAGQYKKLEHQQYGLEEAVKSRTIELVKERNRAEQATRVKKEFLANMVHEIDTPLNGLLGITGLLMDTQLNEEQRNYLQIMQKSGNVILEVVSNILDISQIEAGDLELEVNNFSLYSTIEDITNRMALRAHEKHIELLVEFATGVEDFYLGDSNRIRQIIQNLLANAINFTDGGYIVLRIRSEDIERKNARLYFEVEDTGIGIPANKQKFIFNKYTQVEESAARKYYGTGLGLNICKNLTEMMAGSISVESELGKGSIFYFNILLPYGEKKKQEVSYPEIDISKLRALVVDDLPVNGKILCGYLNRWGVMCNSVSSTNEAKLLLDVAYQSGKPYQIVFIDRQMPDINGMELAYQIKNDEKFNDTVCVRIATTDSVVTQQSMLQNGFLGFYMKPYHPLQIKNLILRVWEAHEKKNYSQLITHNSVALYSSRDSTSSDVEPLIAPFEQGKRVLVVDGMHVNRTLLKEMLKKMKHQIDIAGNGIEALEYYGKNTYDVILMDCNMPEMDGYQATREIRNMENGKTRIPIIAITSDAMKSNEQRCLNAGMDDFLIKPIRRERLAIMIEKWTSNQAADLVTLKTRA